MDGNTNWIKFFKESGIPNTSAAKYAVIFSNHRIQLNMLRDLNKEILYDMGIKTIGDVIAILRHAKEVDEEAEKVQVLGEHLNSVQAKSAVKILNKTATAAPVSNEPSTTVKSLKRSLPIEPPESANKRKSINESSQQQQQSSIEYLSKGSTYVIKMPNFASAKPIPPSTTVLSASAAPKGSIFSRLGGTQQNVDPRLAQQQKTKISFNNSNAIQNKISFSSLPDSLTPASVFSRLGAESTINTSLSRAKVNTCNEQSVLRGVRGADGGVNVFTGKATATVKPTNLIIRKSVNTNESGRVTNSISYNRSQTLPGLTKSNNKLNAFRSTNAAKSLKITQPSLQQQTSRQTISLKKSVFDRLGPVKS